MANALMLKLMYTESILLKGKAKLHYMYAGKPKPKQVPLKIPSALSEWYDPFRGCMLNFVGNGRGRWGEFIGLYYGLTQHLI